MTVLNEIEACGDRTGHGVEAWLGRYRQEWRRFPELK